MIIDALNRQVIELSQMLRKEEERNLCKVIFHLKFQGIKIKFSLRYVFHERSTQFFLNAAILFLATTVPRI